MTRSISKAQAKVIIFREVQVNLILQAFCATAIVFVSVTLAVALVSYAIASAMRAYLMVEGRSGAEVKVPATGLAIAFPWLFLIASGEYMMHSDLPLFLLITCGSAVYFGAIRKDNPVHASVLNGG